LPDNLGQISQNGLLDGVAVAQGPAVVDHEDGVPQVQESVGPILKAVVVVTKRFCLNMLDRFWQTYNDKAMKLPIKWSTFGRL
jgi:hypothetical protein